MKTGQIQFRGTPDQDRFVDGYLNARRIGSSSSGGEKKKAVVKVAAPRRRRRIHPRQIREDRRPNPYRFHSSQTVNLRPRISNHERHSLGRFCRWIFLGLISAHMFGVNPASLEAKDHNATHTNSAIDNPVPELTGGNSIYTLMNGAVHSGKVLNEVYLTLTFKTGEIPALSRVINASYGASVLIPGSKFSAIITGQKLYLWYGFQDLAQETKPNYLAFWQLTVTGVSPLSKTETYLGYHGATATEMPDLYTAGGVLRQDRLKTVSITNLANEWSDQQMPGVTLNGMASKVIVLVHGWNPDQRTNHYGIERQDKKLNDYNATDDFKWHDLALNLLGNPVIQKRGWKVARYDWHEDAATGPLFPEFLDNPNAARDAGNAHGYNLANLLNSVQRTHVHFICHSAGNWAARRAAARLTALRPDIQIQITSLDPFVNDDDTGGGFNLQPAFDMLPQWVSPVGKLKLLENYYVVDDELLRGGTDILGWTSGNFTQSGWNNCNLEGLDFDSSYLYNPGTMHTHGGPVAWYAQTAHRDQMQNVSLRQAGNDQSLGFLYSLAVREASFNDSFSSPDVLDAQLSVTPRTWFNYRATKEDSEPNHGGNWGGRSVWGMWTAPAAGNATFDTYGSDFYTSLAVYTGTSVGSLTAVASDTSGVKGNGLASVTFTAVAGQTYRIAVDGLFSLYGAQNGKIVLNASFVATGGPPPTPVAIISPASGGTVGGTGIVTATAAGATAMQFYLDGELQFTSTTAPFSWSWITTQTPNGLHAVGAQAYNGASLIGTSPAVTITVANSTTPTDADANEPNNSSTQATALTSGSPAQGRISSPTDVDWFKIVVTAPGTLTCNLTVPSGKDYDLELYGGVNPVFLKGSYENPGLAESISYDAATIGTYYVRVYGYPIGNGSFSTTTPYSLAYNFTPNPVTLPTFTVTAPVPNAAEQNNVPGRFTIARTGGTTPALVVNYTLGGTAQNGIDYLSLSGTATLPVGAISVDVVVTPIDDAIPEPTETATLTLSASSAYTVGTPNSATVTIVDNDTPAGGTDAQAPRLDFINPNGTPSYTTLSTILVNGKAYDNVGVTRVSWSNDRGGSGTADTLPDQPGTLNWSVSALPLMNGANVITMTAYDAAGNSGTARTTIQATLPPTYMVTPSAGPNGNINPTVPLTVNSGQNAQFSALPANGYVVAQWLVNNIGVQNGLNTYTLWNVTAATSVRVTFKVAPAVSLLTPILANESSAIVNAFTATLNVYVNANGDTTTVWFEWGTDPTLAAYALTASQPIGSGARPVDATLSQLAPSTTFYFRASAANSYGTMKSSSIRSFTTPALTPSSVITWGDANERIVPAGLFNVVSIAAAQFHALALNADGTITAWGQSQGGWNNVPTGMASVVATAGGSGFTLALRSDGHVVAWGQNDLGQTNVPAGLTNVVAVTAGSYHSLALKGDGTVVGWGRNDSSQANSPSGLSAVVAVAAGDYHSLALRSDGAVVGWGNNTSGQIDVQTGLNSVSAIAAGANHSLALKADGTVVAWGWNGYGQTDVPSGLNNVAAIAAGQGHSLALKNDGTVVAWGRNVVGQIDVPSGLNSVAAIAAGSLFSMALTNTGLPICVQQPQGQAINPGGSVLFRTTAIGKVPLAYQWQLNGQNIAGATNQALFVANGTAAQGGSYSVVVNNSVGIAISSPALLQVSVPVAITWAIPADLTYGMTLTASQLNATANVPGSFSYLPVEGTALNAGSQTLTATFTPTDTINYTTATKTLTLGVNKTALSILPRHLNVVTFVIGLLGSGRA